MDQQYNPYSKKGVEEKYIEDQRMWYRYIIIYESKLTCINKIT